MSREDSDVRVEDYLNDKLQTGADLDNIDTLLENVIKQQDLLKRQVGKWIANISMSVADSTTA